MTIEQKLQVVMLIENNQIEEARKLAYSFGADEEDIDFLIAICQGLKPNDVIYVSEPS